MNKKSALFAILILVSGLFAIGSGGGGDSSLGDCWICDGTGTNDCALCVNGDYGSCTFCNGKGYDTCTFCNGTGN